MKQCKKCGGSGVIWRLREAGMSVDPPEKTYRHILRRINAEARRKPMNDQQRDGK